MDFSLLFGIACAIGIITHLAVFIRGEWERHTPRIAKLALLAEVILAAYIGKLNLFIVKRTLVDWVISNAGFAIGLLGSLGLYRVFFHALRHYPGPLGAKLTGFYSIGLTVPNFQFYKEVNALHQKYGDFVRIRPREISISHVDAIRDIHGPGTKCMTRDEPFHSRRKRVWEKGLATTALSDYEPRVLEHCQEFLAQISKRAHCAIEITEWLGFFGFDVMGDLAFGKSFQMLKTGKPTYQ
ncbi:cytochrome P450 [Aspergillus ellipticus CBS 707.79]|uniref:Cytochrome P450 n=1 Tax=Aspergillus ellipticus CBS 707.79 TaxID=1448320 RepID=A0A319DP50_9EURO|nr:cytochrome P450 [Aspergillus ellipticus CBS 707.79]